jgi:hypothetical protein
MTNQNKSTHKPFYVNRGLWQGCSLSPPPLVDLYINEELRKWKISNHRGIKLRGDCSISTIFFTDCCWQKTKMTCRGPLQN